MEVTVLLFGPQSLQAGAGHVTVRIEQEEPTTADVMAGLRESVPALADSLGTSRLAVNHEFAEAQQKIRSGDEVALIGLVGGG